MSTTKSKTPTLVGPPCPSCRGMDWDWHVTYATAIEGQQRTKVGDEIRCHGCGKKATKAINTHIRDTSIFKAIQYSEDKTEKRRATA